jgi:hypothetical protein
MAQEMEEMDQIVFKFVMRSTYVLHLILLISWNVTLVYVALI